MRNLVVMMVLAEKSWRFWDLPIYQNVGYVIVRTPPFTIEALEMKNKQNTLEQ